MKIICKKTTKRFLGIFAAASMAAGMICTPLMEKKVYAEENSDGKIFFTDNESANSYGSSRYEWQMISIFCCGNMRMKGKYRSIIHLLEPMEIY